MTDFYRKVNKFFQKFAKCDPLLKIGFVTLDPPRDSDELCILLQGFVWETYVSDMKIVHKIRS